MDNRESSSDQQEPNSSNTIRIGVENKSDGDINVEVTERITPDNGEDILIGVDNHSISGNNNIKVHDVDFKGCGSARIGAGNYAGGCNNIFIGGLHPTNECTPSPASPPRLPNRPAGFPGPLLSPLPNGPSPPIESDVVNSSRSLPRQSPEKQTGNQNRIARFTSRLASQRSLNARQTPQPPNRSKSISRGPVQPLLPNGPLPPNPTTKPF